MIFTSCIHPQQFRRFTMQKNGMKIVLRGVHGRILGNESQGESRSWLQQSPSDLLAAKCDVIFCACRIPGGGCRWLS